jgi:hypothetical protein
LTSRRCFWAQCNSGGLTKATNAAPFGHIFVVFNLNFVILAGFATSSSLKTTNAALFGRIFIVFSLNFVILTSRTLFLGSMQFRQPHQGDECSFFWVPFQRPFCGLRHKIGWPALRQVGLPLDVILAGSGLFLDVLLAGPLLDVLLAASSFQRRQKLVAGTTTIQAPFRHTFGGLRPPAAA